MGAGRAAAPGRRADLPRDATAGPTRSLTLVGITGTNGKTTVAHLVESIASAAGRRAGRIGTVGHAFARNRARARTRTTPEAPDLYRLLAEMRDESVDLVAMEVSSHALALHRVEGARFATAAFLNLSRDHLDFHGDEEAYFAAKAKLFEALGPRECAVLPADSTYGERMRRARPARVLTFGRSERADVRLREEHCGLDGSSAILETPDGLAAGADLPARPLQPGQRRRGRRLRAGAGSAAGGDHLRRAGAGQAFRAAWSGSTAGSRSP